MSKNNWSKEPGSKRIRNILKSIRRANEVRHAVLPKRAKVAAPHLIDPFHTDPRPRSRSYYRGLLLLKGGFAGGCVGASLGLNVGVALPIILGQLWMLAVAPILFALCGWTYGVSLARVRIAQSRADLFRWE